MNRAELIQELSARAALTRAQAAKVVEALFSASEGIISQALHEDDKVNITGFGSFVARHRAARTGRNPRTGKEIQIAASTSPVFRGGKGLKDSLSA